MKVPGRMSKPATNSPHCHITRGRGEDWLAFSMGWEFGRVATWSYFWTRISCVWMHVFPNTREWMYFQEKTTDKHTPCCRPPSHRWAGRRWSRRSRVQCPESKKSIYFWRNKETNKRTFTSGLNPPSTLSIFAQACRKPGVNFKRKPWNCNDVTCMIIFAHKYKYKHCLQVVLPVETQELYRKILSDKMTMLMMMTMLMKMVMMLLMRMVMMIHLSWVSLTLDEKK